MARPKGRAGSALSDRGGPSLALIDPVNGHATGTAGAAVGQRDGGRTASFGRGIQLGQGRGDFVEVARVARGPALFVRVEVGEEGVAGPDRGDPLVDPDRGGEVADV